MNGDGGTLLERPWLPALVTACREAGLDWLRMAAAAEILSRGDASRRVVDWAYIRERLGQDNPRALPIYHADGSPSLDLIDRGTRWGLYQVHGDRAVEAGFKGRLVGLASMGSSIKLGVSLVVEAIDAVERRADRMAAAGDLEGARRLVDALPGSAEEAALGVRSADVDEAAEELRRSIVGLTELTR